MMFRLLNGRSVERALFNEVTALRWQACAVAAEIARRHEAGEPFDRPFFTLWPLSEPTVYAATGARSFGLLSGAARTRLHYFHGQLAAARTRMRRAEAAGGFEPSPYRVLSNLVRSKYELDPWILALRPRLGGMLEDEPDIRAANNLVAKFENAGSEPIAVAYCPADCAYGPNETDQPIA